MANIIQSPKKLDTNVVNSYIRLSEALFLANADTVIPLCIKAEKIAKELLQQNPPEAVERRLKISLAECYNNIGFVYDHKGEVKKALSYYHKSLRIEEEQGNKEGIALSLNNIGLLHYYQGEIENAMEYYQKSLALRREVNDQYGIAMSLNNIGFVYDNQNKLDIALDYYLQALQIGEEIENDYIISSIVNNVGIIYNKQSLILIKDKAPQDSINDKMEKALYYFNKSLAIQEESDDKEGVTTSLINVGTIYFRQNKVLEAEQNAQRSLELARELSFPKNIMDAASLLSKIYEKKQDGKQALVMYKLYIQMRDSINNEETQKATIRQQTQYEFEKEQIRKENEAKEQARIEAEELKRRNNMEYSLIFLGILALFGLVMMLGFIKVSPNIAEGLIFFTFLIFFEFVLVFAEPYINDYTDGEPIYTLIANAGIALLIFPLHDKLEDLLKKRIVK